MDRESLFSIGGLSSQVKAELLVQMDGTGAPNIDGFCGLLSHRIHGTGIVSSILFTYMNG